MAGDSHAVTASSSAADPVSAAERRARAAAVLVEAEASAAGRAAAKAAAAAAVASAAASAESARKAAVARAAEESSGLGVAWVDHPADVPVAASFAGPGDVAAIVDHDASVGASGNPAAGRRRGRGRGAPGPEQDPESVARGIVLRQLTMAPRSRVQLERKLSERGCDEDVAARVLDRMTEVGLVDDEAYAQMLVRVRHTEKGLARRALSHELRRQGIEQELADVALRQVDAGDERSRAEQLVEKRLRSLHGLAPDVQSRRLAGLLERKGYSSEIAYPVIRDAVANAQEHRRD